MPGDQFFVLSQGNDPADLDLDGDVDDADFGIAFAAFTGPNNGPSANPAADLDNDGDVDDADFGIAFAAFTGPGGPASVPEPTSLALLGLGGLAHSTSSPGIVIDPVCGSAPTPEWGRPF